MPVAAEESPSPTTSNAAVAEQGTVLYANVTGRNQPNGTGHTKIEILVRNVVCNYSLPLHVDLKSVAMNSRNVWLDKGRGVLLKQKRDPYCHVKVYNSGSVYISGCKSEEECRRAARGVGRMIQRSMQKLDSSIRLRDFKINNMLATCKLPFGVKIEEMAKHYPQAVYEPELTVGMTWKFEEPKSTLRIHTTGSITITGATSSQSIVRAIELIYPLVEEFKCPLRGQGGKLPVQRHRPASTTTVFAASSIPMKQPRKIPADYDPFELFEDSMKLKFEGLDEEEEFFEENLC